MNNKNYPGKLLRILFVVSLVANILIIYKYTQIASPLNTTWANATQKFVQYAHWVSIDANDMAKFPTEETLAYKDINLRLIEEELESLRILPYAQSITPYQLTEKIRILAGYQRNVLNLMQTELEGQGRVSTENADRMRIAGKAWEKLVATLTREENKIDPFAPFFREKAWQKTWEQGITAMEEVELLPLPEKVE